MEGYIKVARVDDIPEGGMKPVQAGPTRVLVCHLEDGFFAVADECSHNYVPLNTGQILGDRIVCHHHGAEFLGDWRHG